MNFKIGTIVQQLWAAENDFLLILKEITEGESEGKCLVCDVKINKQPKRKPYIKEKLKDGRVVFVNCRYFFEVAKELLYPTDLSFVSSASVHKEVFIKHKRHVDTIKKRRTKKEQKHQKDTETKKSKSKKESDYKKEKEKENKTKRKPSLTKRYEIASINNDRKTMEEIGYPPGRIGLLKGKSGCSNGTFQSYLKPYLGGRYTPR